MNAPTPAVANATAAPASNATGILSFLTSRLFIVGVFFIASLINGFALISLPWQSTSTMCIVQTNFNQNTFNGTLNGMEVLSLSTVRLGIWAACYSDLDHSIASHTCLPWKVGYEIILTKGDKAHIVVQPIFSGCLISQGFAFVFTLLPTFFAAFLYNNWLPLCALAFTSLVIVTNLALYYSVDAAMQAYGEGVTTGLGPAFGFIVLALFLIICGYIAQYFAVKKEQKKEEEKEKGEKEAQRKARYADATLVTSKYDVENTML